MKDPTRPRTRAGCNVEGVCPFVSCRHHLFLDVNQTGSIKTGALKYFVIGRSPADFDKWAEDLTDRLVEADHTCALDAAEDGPRQLDQIGELIGVSRQRVRQVEIVAVESFQEAAAGGMSD